MPRATLLAQTPPPKPPPDHGWFWNDDEKLVGHFVRSNRGDLRFRATCWRSDDPLDQGERTARRRPVHCGRQGHQAGPQLGYIQVAEGSLDATAKQITVTGAPGAAPETVAVADAAHVIESSEFEQQVMHSPGPGEDWTGSINAGATLVEATQQSAPLAPVSPWCGRCRWKRGSIRATARWWVFNFASGIVKQPGTAEIKTDILHGGLERDEYFSDPPGCMDSRRRRSITTTRKVWTWGRKWAAGSAGRW